MARDGIDETAARHRMSAQQADDFYCRDGVTVLHNTADAETLQKQAVALWQDEGWWSTE